MNAQELLKGELIGKYVVVLESTNKANLGKKGRILDETKNILVISDCDSEISDKKKRKKLVKNECVFGFYETDDIEIKNPIDRMKITKIDGRKIIGRPEDRVKMKVKHEKKHQ